MSSVLPTSLVQRVVCRCCGSTIASILEVLGDSVNRSEDCTEAALVMGILGDLSRQRSERTCDLSAIARVSKPAHELRTAVTGRIEYLVPELVRKS